jgi:hypothetical protein
MAAAANYQNIKSKGAYAIEAKYFRDLAAPIYYIQKYK